MEISELNKPMLKDILRTSDKMTAPSQRIELKKNADKTEVRRPRQGHPIAEHVSGAVQKLTVKTKFRSLADMVNSLWLLLNTPTGKGKLKKIVAHGHREELEEQISRLVPVEAFIKKIGKVNFTTSDLSRAGIKLRGVAVLEGRERAGRIYLHVQTFYPELSAQEIEKLLDAKTTA